MSVGGMQKSNLKKTWGATSKNYGGFNAAENGREMMVAWCVDLPNRVQARQQQHFWLHPDAVRGSKSSVIIKIGTDNKVHDDQSRYEKRPSLLFDRLATHSGGNDRFCARLKTDISAFSSGL
jgi:hypothetical protein